MITQHDNTTLEFDLGTTLSSDPVVVDIQKLPDPPLPGHSYLTAGNRLIVLDGNVVNPAGLVRILNLDGDILGSTSTRIEANIADLWSEVGNIGHNDWTPG